MNPVTMRPGSIGGGGNAQLRVTVHSATGLRKADWFGKSDPYAIVQLLGPGGKVKEEFKTEVVKNNLNPTWNVQIELATYSAGDQLSFTVMDEDPWPKPHDFLGKAVLSSENFYPYGYEGTLVLNGAGKGVNARMQVKVEILGVGLASPHDMEEVGLQPQFASGGAIPTTAAHFRPPEPMPDKPIESIASLGSSMSPTSMGSYGLPGSYGQIPVTRGNVPGSYGQEGLIQSQNIAGLYAEDLPSSTAARPSKEPTYESQSIGSVQAASSAAPQFQSTSIGSHQIGSIGSADAFPERPPVGSYPAGSFPTGSLQASQEAVQSGSFQTSANESYAMGSYQKPGSVQMGSFPKMHVSDAEDQLIQAEAAQAAAPAAVRRLRVFVQYARGLRSVDFAGKCDTYAVFESPGRLAQQTAFKTDIIGNCIDPVWNHEVEVDYLEGAPLRFAVMGKDVWPKPDSFLGMCELGVEDFLPHGFQGEVNLQDVGPGVAAVLGIAVFPPELLEQQAQASDESPEVFLSQAPERPVVSGEFDTEIMQDPESFVVKVRVMGATGLLDCAVGSRGECFVQVWDRSNTLLLQTPSVLEMDTPVWESEHVIRQSGPLSFEVCRDQELLGSAVLEELPPPEGMEMDFRLSKDGQPLNAVLTVQLFLLDSPQYDPRPDLQDVGQEQEMRQQQYEAQAREQEMRQREDEGQAREQYEAQAREQEMRLREEGGQARDMAARQEQDMAARQEQEMWTPPPRDHGYGTISITVVEAKLNQLTDFVELGQNPPFFVVAETADRSANFSTPTALTTSGDSPCPMWRYKQDIQDYTGERIDFGLLMKTASGATSGVLGQCSLRLDQLYPFGFDGDLTISDVSNGGGILGLLHVQVALAGRSAPQAAVDPQPSSVDVPMARAVAPGVQVLGPSQLPTVVQPVRVSQPLTVTTPLIGSMQVTPEGSYAPVANPLHIQGLTAAEYAATGMPLTVTQPRLVPQAEYVPIARMPLTTTETIVRAEPFTTEYALAARAPLTTTETVVRAAPIATEYALPPRGQLFTAETVAQQAPAAVGVARAPRAAVVLGKNSATTMPSATVGFDTNLDGNPNFMVSGPDRNFNGIPDFLEGAAGGANVIRAQAVIGPGAAAGVHSATVGFDTNLNGSPNILVTGPDLNFNGIPDFLEGAQQPAAQPAAAPRAAASAIRAAVARATPPRAVISHEAPVPRAAIAQVAAAPRAAVTQATAAPRARDLYAARAGPSTVVSASGGQARPLTYPQARLQNPQMYAQR